MKVLILGGRGRLAAALARVWARSHEVEVLSRPEADVRDAEALQKILRKCRFDVLVNGTGLTNVDRCETDRDEAWEVNARAPGLMAASARTAGARLIHFSTDYVFDGQTPDPLAEESPARPLGWYGQTKREGELAVLADSAAHWVVRVSWVFGPDKPSFIDMILDRARTGQDLTAVADKYSCPTYSLDAASWLEPILTGSGPGGLLHLCNPGACSWHDMATFALRCARDAGIPLASADVRPLRLEEMRQFLAPRPRESVLSTEKLTRLTGIRPRPWQEAVREYINSQHAPVLPSA